MIHTIWLVCVVVSIVSMFLIFVGTRRRVSDSILSALFLITVVSIVVQWICIGVGFES